MGVTICPYAIDYVIQGGSLRTMCTDSSYSRLFTADSKGRITAWDLEEANFAKECVDSGSVSRLYCWQAHSQVCG